MIADLELIDKWKSQFGDIFGIELDGTEFVYRALTLNEINYVSRIDEQDTEDYYVKNALLYPVEFDVDDMRAGDFKILAEAIMSVSGILDVETVKNYLADSRQRITNDVISVMKAYVIAAMPTYRDDELDNLTIKQMIEKVVLSEQILTLQQAIMGIESDGVKVQIISAEEQQEAQKPPPTKKQIKRTREELLQQVRGEERETVNPRMRATEGLNSIPDDLLEKIAQGAEPDPSDPIAAKLFGMG